MWPDFPLFPDAASSVAREVDALFLGWVVISLFFSVLIAALIVIFFMKYRRRPWRRFGHDAEIKTLPVEITWSVIPLVITLVMFVWGAKVFFDQSRPPEDAIAYYGVGKQWMWKFQHPEGAREINDLHVPVGQPIRITLTSEDVIHSLFIPAFRVKSDVLPGRYTTVWFEATRPGEYHLFCTEYCGTEHSRMIGTVYALAPEDYETWLATGQTGVPLRVSGGELFSRFACDTCHRMERATPELPARGPSLAGLFGTEVELVGGGTVTADATYLRRSILEPQAHVVAGWQPIMPTFKGQMSEEQLNALVDYVKNLPAGTQTADEDGAPGAAGESPASNAG
jgi:cytochrome c oxidase subunit 2